MRADRPFRAAGDADGCAALFRDATRKRDDAIRKRKAAFHLRRCLNGSEGPRAAARARLELDGCNGDEAVRRRIFWFAHERKLPLTEIEKALTCRIHHMGGFAVRHKVSLDWLLIGDLQGLRRMPMQQSPSILTATTVVKLYAELTMEQRRKLSLMIAGLLDEAVS